MTTTTSRLAILTAAGLLAGVASGQTFLIDCGPSTGTTPTTGGVVWNNFSPGQFIRLADTSGAFSGAGVPDGIGFGATTGLGSDSEGGLTNPDASLLGPFAVASATGDYLFRFDDGAGSPEVLGLELSSLDPALTYDFRFFGSYISSETRETTYTVTGGNGAQSASLITSGTNIGSDGASFANDNIIVGVTGVSPRANGTILVEAQATQGAFLYLNAMEVRVTPAGPAVEITQQPASAIADAGGTLVFTAAVGGSAGSPELRWSRDGQPLTDGGRVSGATTESLTISPAGLDDVGVYTLVATAGADSATSDGAIGAVRVSPLGIADINNDGVLNIFDILAFFDAFAGG